MSDGLVIVAVDGVYCHIANDNTNYPMNYCCNEIVLGKVFLTLLTVKFGKFL